MLQCIAKSLHDKIAWSAAHRFRQARPAASL